MMKPGEVELVEKVMRAGGKVPGFEMRDHWLGPQKAVWIGCAGFEWAEDAGSSARLAFVGWLTEWADQQGYILRRRVCRDDWFILKDRYDRLVRNGYGRLEVLAGQWVRENGS